MATMDVFEGDAFGIIELTRALENIPFKPALLVSAGSSPFMQWLDYLPKFQGMIRIIRKGRRAA